MNLFNRKTLKRHIKADPIPSDHLAALEAWAELISSGRIERLKETALHGQFASKIVEGVLGYHGPAGPNGPEAAYLGVYRNVCGTIARLTCWAVRLRLRRQRGIFHGGAHIY
jgi:hypothetical protein